MFLNAMNSIQFYSFSALYYGCHKAALWPSKPFTEPLTRIYQFETLAGSCPIAIKLNPQMVGGTIDDDIGHFAFREIAQQSWWTALAIIDL